MCRWVSTKPGMTIMSVASITSTSPFARPGPTATIWSPSMRTSPFGKSPTVGIEASMVPPRISFPRRHDAEVGSGRVEGWQVGCLRWPAPDHQSPGSPVVPLHELLDVSDLEQDDPDQDQNADDHRTVVR